MIASLVQSQTNESHNLARCKQHNNNNKSDNKMEVEKNETKSDQDWEKLEDHVPVEGEEKSSDESNPYIGLHFDTLVVTGMIFTKCESGNSCDSRTGKPMCKSCLSRNHYMMFAYVQPHEFEFVVPPKLFTELYPMYTMRGVSTMEVLALMVAGVDYFDALFNPDHPFADVGEVWRKHARVSRQKARDIWLPSHEQFQNDLVSSKSMLEMIQVLERRLVTGQGLCHFVNGKKKTTEEWTQWVEAQLAENASLRLIPWTFERCKSDRVSECVEAVRACNEFKRTTPSDK